MPRAPRPDEPAGSAGAAPPWAADESRAAAPAPADTAQMPLFHGDAPAPARVRRVRLRTRIKALLSARLGRKAAPPSADEAGGQDSSWPDSFFDGPGS